MLHRYFDKTYLINLASRKDRLELSQKVCAEIGLEFTRYEAIPGETIRDVRQYDEHTTLALRWNNNAAGLVKTTLNILLEAREKKYKSILILEDDVQFNPILPKILEQRMPLLPTDWQLFYFGATHLTAPDRYSPFMARVTNANSCHCYAIHHTLYDRLIELISPIELPIDYYLRKEIHPEGKTYCFIPNMAWQFSGYSDIQGGYLNTDFIRQY
jgi:GR25 family glycosyltransferase involved in LPS biosynthesis